MSVTIVGADGKIKLLTAIDVEIMDAENERLSAENARLKIANADLSKDAAIGRAIRGFIEQDTGAFEAVHLQLELIKGGSCPARHDELDNKGCLYCVWNDEQDNKVCLYIDISKNPDQEPSHISVHGDNLYDALIAAGLLNEEGK